MLMQARIGFFKLFNELVNRMFSYCGPRLILETFEIQSLELWNKEPNKIFVGRIYKEIPINPILC